MPKQSFLNRKIGELIQKNVISPLQKTLEGKNKGIISKTLDFSQFNAVGNFLANQFSPHGGRAQLEAYEGWVYSCVKKISQTSAQIPLNLFQKKGKEVVQLSQHNVIDLIERTNEFMTYFDLIEIISTYLNLTGEAFVFKERANNGEVIGLYPWLIPTGMTVIPGSDKFISGYIYQSPMGGEQISFDSEDIIYFKLPDPQNPYRGLGPVRAASLDISTEQKAKEYNWRFFDNNATPRGILETEHEINQDTFDRIKVQFENRHRGEENAYKTAILDQGLHYNPIGFSHTDMDFFNQRAFSRDAILSIFGVPKSILGIVEDVNRANAESSRRTFLEETIQPFMKKIVGVLNEQLIVPDFDESLFLDFADLTPEDEQKKLERYQNALNNGWMSRNEVRTAEGLEPVNGADQLLVPFNLVPVASTEETKAITIVPQNMEKRYRTEDEIIQDKVAKEYKRRTKKILKKYNIDLDKTTTKDHITKSPACRMANETQVDCISRKIPEIMKEDPDISQDQAVAIAESFCKIPCESKKKDFNTDQKELIWKQLDLGVRKQVPAFARVIMKLYEEQEQRVLRNLRKFFSKKTSRKDIEDILLSVDEEREEFQKLLQSPEVIIIINTGVSTADLFDFINTQIKEPDARAFAFRSIEKFAKSNTITINKKLADALIDSIDSGDSLPDLIEVVKGVYDTIDDVSAERIARTELTRITTWSNEEIYKQAGVTLKEWQANPGACEFCLPLAGEVIPISENYFEKNEVAIGKDGGFLNLKYETVTRPPLHVNCRCNLIPVVQI